MTYLKFIFKYKFYLLALLVIFISSIFAWNYVRSKYYVQETSVKNALDHLQEPKPAPVFVEDNLIIELEKGLNFESFEVQAFVDDIKPEGFQEYKKLVEGQVLLPSLQNYYVLKFNKKINLEKLLQICGRYKESVLSCETDTTFNKLKIPNEKTYTEGSLWYIKAMKLDQAWDITTGGNVRIGIIDFDEIDSAHPDLNKNIRKSDLSGQNPTSHTTAVAGCIAAIGNNEIGNVGAMWNSNIYAYKIKSASEMAEAINKAVADGVKIINFSIASRESLIDKAPYKAVEDAYQLGVFFVAASGNCGNDMSAISEARCRADANISPQNFPLVLLAGALDKNEADRTIFSSYYPRMKERGVLAPGIDIMTTAGGGLYWGKDALPFYDKNTGQITYKVQPFAGTSAAAPFIAGVAGLILSVNPSLKPLDIIELLTLTAIDLKEPGPDEKTGYGKVDACLAVYCAIPGNAQTCFNRGELLIDRESVCPSSDGSAPKPPDSGDDGDSDNPPIVSPPIEDDKEKNPETKPTPTPSDGKDNKEIDKKPEPEKKCDPLNEFCFL